MATFYSQWPEMCFLYWSQKESMHLCALVNKKYCVFSKENVSLIGIKSVTFLLFYFIIRCDLSFLLRSVHDLLPPPANLCRWGLSTNPTCKICDRPGTLEHVLSSCSSALTKGRFRWRHDTVLREAADWLEMERKKDRRCNPQQHHTTLWSRVKLPWHSQPRRHQSWEELTAIDLHTVRR